MLALSTLSHCLFNLYAEYIMQNARLEESQAGIKAAGRNNNNLTYAITLMAESEEKLKSLLLRVKKERVKAGLELNIQKTKNMLLSSHITWRQIDGGKTEIVTDFLFLGSKITVDCGCSHEIKRCLFLGRKAMTNLDSILKNRDMTLPTKVCIVKAMLFPVVMYRYESWTIKKAECQRIDVFRSWRWRSLESPLDCKEIKPINPKWNQPWICIGRTDAEAGDPILCPLDDAFSLFLTYFNFPCFPSSFVILKYILISILGILWQDIFSR